MVNKSMRSLGAIFFLLFVLVIAGCGGSGKEALSKSEFVKQGNAICAEATEAREKIIVEISKATNPDANQEAIRERALSRLLSVYEGAAQQIGELGAPAGDEAKVEGIVEAMEEAAMRAKASPQTAAVGNLPFRKANAAAESYGLKACTI